MELTYSTYLHLDELLNLQRPRSQNPSATEWPALRHPQLHRSAARGHGYCAAAQCAVTTAEHSNASRAIRDAGAHRQPGKAGDVDSGRTHPGHIRRGARLSGDCAAHAEQDGLISNQRVLLATEPGTRLETQPQLRSAVLVLQRESPGTRAALHH